MIIPLVCPRKGDSADTLNLSSRLAVRFSRNDKFLQRAELDRLGMTLQQAWNIGASNTLRRSCTTSGIRFWTRPSSFALGPEAPRGLEVRCQGPIGAWLAHPRPFATLDQHLRQLTGAARMIYLLPTNHRLVALHLISDAEAYHWARVFAGESAETADFPLVWSHGFPQELGLLERRSRLCHV